jgi:hypothetical protein
MIYQNSRYYTQLIDYISFDVNTSQFPIVFYEFATPGISSWNDHIYSQGERLDALSFRYYDRSDLWWLIVEHNPEVDDFTNIIPGTVLRIPRV